MSFIVGLHFRFSFFRKMPRAAICLLAAAVALLVAFQYRQTGTLPVGWERSFQVSPFNIVARDVAVDSRGSIVAVAYEGTGGGARGIYASLSFNGGASFMPAVRVADARSQTPMYPQISVSPNGSLAVMWQAYLDDEATTRIFHSSSADLGATWSAPKRIPLGKDMEMLPRVYYDDRNELHLFYHGGVSDIITLYHAVSENGADFKTTGSLMRITGSMRGAFFPSIHCAGPNIFIVWQGKEEDFSDELFFMRSTNYGRSWSMKKQITDSQGNNDSPSVALLGDTLYVAYQNNDDKNWAIKMIRGVDRGWSWEEAPIQVSATAASCYSPAVGVSGGDIIVLWYDTRDGRGRIFARKYSTRDSSFAAESEVSEARYESKNPVVVSMGGRLIVFWEERNIVMAKQTDVYAAPPGVFSETNPEGKWSRLPFVVMKWRPPADESGVAGYAANANELPDFNPTVMNMKANQTTDRLTDVRDGVTYYHIRTVDGAGNFSRTVHYKLQLAVNPLPAPVIVSQTHPQGKPGESTAPAFAWAVEDAERVKGFVYGLSRGGIAMPETFTTELTAQFRDVPEGDYFFSVAAIDKANQYSRVSNYDFIIGNPDRVLDPDYYKRIAEKEKEFLRKGRFREFEGGREEPVAVPSVAIRFPFDERVPYERGDFRAIIQTRNIPPGSILGYAVYIDDEKRPLPDRINHKGAVIHVRGLASRNYHMGVKCRYRVATAGGGARLAWTAPYETAISVRIPADRSPVVYYAQRVMEKFPRRLGMITLTLFGLGLVVTTLGYGSRLSFYFRLALYRLGIRYRLAVNKEE